MTELTDFEGGYWYEGNGIWAEIKNVEVGEQGPHFNTRSISHETVPHETRERIYDTYDGGVVLSTGDSDD